MIAMKTFHFSSQLGTQGVSDPANRRSPHLSSSVPFVSGLRSGLQKGWQWFVDKMTRDPELRVWKKADRDGTFHWYAYDPATHRTFESGSETDLRIWIEDRYDH